MNTIIVGSLESSDCLITLAQHDKTVIEIDSVVFDAFGEAIKQQITTILNNHHLSNIHLRIQDKGALDYTIEARLERAIALYKEADHES